MATPKKKGLDNTPPSKSSFNKASEYLKTSHRNYSMKELIQKLDNYAKYGKGIHKAKMMDIKDRYLKHYTEAQQKRGLKDFYLKKGIERGIHLRDATQRVDKNRKIIDQANRNITVEKAKRYYHQNYSMSKEFNKPDGPNGPGKKRNKDMNKDR